MWTYNNVVLPAVVPIFLVLLVLWLTRRPIDLRDMIGDGQLCFFATALLAVTLHDIDNMPDAAKHTPWATLHLMWAVPTCYLTGVLATLIFVVIVIEKANAPRLRTRLTFASCVITLFSLAVVYNWRINLDLFPGIPSTMRPSRWSLRRRTPTIVP
jgi:hypothetical protein